MTLALQNLKSPNRGKPSQNGPGPDPLLKYNVSDEQYLACASISSGVGNDSQIGYVFYVNV